MRVIVQRVTRASCSVNNEIVSKIDTGFMLLVGFNSNDDKTVIPKMVKKVSGLRIFEDENGKMNRSLHDVNGKILSISQFTLYANCKNGNRPSFTEAMPGNEAILLYNEFNNALRENNFEVLDGVFGEYMKIDFINDGPCTIILDSNEL